MAVTLTPIDKSSVVSPTLVDRVGSVTYEQGSPLGMLLVWTWADQEIVSGLSVTLIDKN